MNKYRQIASAMTTNNKMEKKICTSKKNGAKKKVSMKHFIRKQLLELSYGVHLHSATNIKSENIRVLVIEAAFQPSQMNICCSLKMVSICSKGLNRMNFSLMIAFSLN